MDENVSDCETVFDVEINVHDVGSYEEPKIEARYWIDYAIFDVILNIFINGDVN